MKERITNEKIVYFWTVGKFVKTKFNTLRNQSEQYLTISPSDNYHLFLRSWQF